MKMILLYLFVFLLILLDIAVHLPCYAPLAHAIGNECPPN